MSAILNFGIPVDSVANSIIALAIFNMNIPSLYALFQQSTGVTTDTRNIQNGNLFFALKGDNFNGNTFAATALQNGAAYSIVDEAVSNDERIIKVENVLTTLQQLAFHHRKQFTGKVIALTGSNGKTTTKELIAAVLSTTFKTQATKGNLNNHIGIPLTLLSMPIDVDFAVVEMGANHQNEIDAYCHYTEPDFGLITNVGLAHLEGFGGFEGVVKGKTELYRFLVNKDAKIFINADNELLMNKAAEAGFAENRWITYGTKNAFCTSKIIEGAFLNFEMNDSIIRTNLVGNYNFENVLAACCIGKYFGVPFEKIKSAIESYVPSNNRSQQITKGSNTIILDCYNANPSSMKAALENFALLKGEKKIAILGGMKEMGNSSEEVHQDIATLALSISLHQLIFIGSEFAFAKEKATWFADAQKAKEWFAENLPTDSLILVKGSRANKLEELFV